MEENDEQQTTQTAPVVRRYGHAGRHIKRLSSRKSSDASSETPRGTKSITALMNTLAPRKPAAGEQGGYADSQKHNGNRRQDRDDDGHEYGGSRSTSQASAAGMRTLTARTTPPNSSKGSSARPQQQQQKGEHSEPRTWSWCGYCLAHRSLLNDLIVHRLACWASRRATIWTQAVLMQICTLSPQPVGGTRSWQRNFVSGLCSN